MDEQNTETGIDEGAKLPSLPFWKKALLGVALILSLVGISLYVVDFVSPQESVQSTQGSSNTMRTQSFGPHNLDSNYESPPPAQQTSIQLNDWSSFFMKLGFSFFIGFSIGYALLAFTKLFFLGVGFIALILFGFQYAGLVEVNWAGMEGYYNAFITWLHPHVGSFRDLIITNLSSSGMAAAGLYTGFKR
ncbi:MAG: FUN14 domain-containing protein [Pseudomonadota bacterium]